jgi:hypothetical protein
MPGVCRLFTIRWVVLGLDKGFSGQKREKKMQRQPTGQIPVGMKTRKETTTPWRAGGLHPTLRKVREGWGTRFVVAGRSRQKQQQIPLRG